MRMRPALTRTWIALTALVLAACSREAAPSVLTSTPILRDVTRQVASDRLTVGSLLPPGTDAHSYQPVPQDVSRVSDSKVLVIHGAGYESFLEPLLENVSSPDFVIEAATGVRLRVDDRGEDPHLWLDPNNVIICVDNIREGLTRFDPDGAAVYDSNSKAYIEELQELDAWINGQIAQIPPERRVLVTNHDSLGYFADRYGFRVVGAVIPSFSSDAAPSAQQMAALVEQIRIYEAPAIFLDASDNPELAQQIAAETGVLVVTGLHFESLTDGGPASTYIGMMKHNVTRMVEALR